MPLFPVRAGVFAADADAGPSEGLIAQVPTTWTKSTSNPVIVPGSVSWAQIASPTVVIAEGRVADPIDRFYLYAAPHDVPGGIYLFTAPHPEGPWAPAPVGGAGVSRARVIRREDAAMFADGADHISSPHCIWNPTAGELWLYVHLGGFPGMNRQRTYLWTSADGVTWTEANDGDPVIESDNQYDAGYAGYGKTSHDGSLYHHFYAGFVTADVEKYTMHATSPDGVVWTKQFPPPFVERRYTDAGLPMFVEDGLVLYTGDADAVADFGVDPGVGIRRDKPDATGVWSDPYSRGLTVGASGAWDDWRAVGDDVIYWDGRWWVFYRGQKATDAAQNPHLQEKIGVAYAAAPRHEFGTVGLDTGKVAIATSSVSTTGHAGRVSVLWTLALDGDVNGYDVQVADDSAGSPGTWTTAETATMSNTYNDDDLADGEVRWYRVRVSPDGDWSTPASGTAVAPLVFTESFNKANGALGPDLTWYKMLLTAVVVVSNQARVDGTTSLTPYYLADHVVGVDGYAQGDYTLHTTGVSGRLLGRFARSATRAGYLASLRYSSGWEIQLVRFVGDSATNIVTATGVPYTTGETVTMRLEVVGGTQRVFLDGVEVVSASDATITTGDYYGFSMGTGGAAASNLLLDNFETGTL